MGGKNFNFFRKYFIFYYSLDKNTTNDQNFTNNTHNTTTGAIIEMNIRITERIDIL